MGDFTGSIATFGSISLKSPSGVLGDLVNTNCEVLAAGSGVSGAGANLTLTLNVHFRPGQGSGDPTTNPPGVPGFIGLQNIYMMTTSSDQQQPGSFQWVGTWTAFPVPEPNTYSSITAPNSVNADGTVTVGLYDLNGYNYQTYAQVVFGGSSQTDPSACRIIYNRGTGAANHVLSLYAGDFTAAGLIGSAPVGTPGAIVQNNSTCVLDIGRSYVVQESGTGAVVNLALTFKSTGAINTYAQGFDRQNAGGAPEQSSIAIAPNTFSLLPLSALSVQQSGAAAAFVVSAPTSGDFSGAVSLSYTAPAGVTLLFNSASLDGPGGASTTAVQVSASASATVGTGNIAITGTSGTLSYLLNVPVTVAPATPPPPPPPASGFSLSSVTPVVAQQSGAAASFTLGVPTTGSFSGPVAFSYTAPAGVTLAFQPNTITVPSATSTSVQVTASASAAVGAGNIAITATSGSLSYPLSVALTVTAAANTVTTVVAPPASPTPTFVISGGRPQTLSVSSSTSAATFVVTVTGVNGFAQPVTVSVDANETSNYISASINGSSSATVSPGQSVSVTVQGLGSTVSNFYCTGVVATGGGMQVFGAPLCINITGAANSISFSVPAVPNGVTIPIGTTATVYGSLSAVGSAPSPSFSQFVTCPVGVVPCNAVATATISNGLVSITLDPKNVPPGTAIQHTMYVDGIEQDIAVSCPYPSAPVGHPPSVTPGLEILSYEGYPPDNSGKVYIFNDDVPETYEIVCLGSNNCSALACSMLDSNVSITLSGQTNDTAFATFTAATSTTPGTKQISCNLPNATYPQLVVGVYDAPPFITDAQLSAPLVPGGATVTLSIFGLHFGNSQGSGTLGVCSAGATSCTSTPDISFGSIIDWGCTNPGYCRIDVPVTAQSTANGTYDLVVNAAGTAGAGFVADPDGSQQRAVSVNRGKIRTQSQRPITIYLLHGIGQTGGQFGAMNNLKGVLTRLGTGLDQTRYIVDAGFSFGECSAVGKNCTVSQYGDKCSVDAGGRSLAHYIAASPPPGDIVLIGYSMGGLIARNMIANNYLATFAPGYTGGKIAGLVTLGTPHLGYPYEDGDDELQCPQLDQDMLGGWAPLLARPVELPPLTTINGSPDNVTFFGRLRQSWSGASLTYWLAVAGTVYTNSSRTFPIMGGGCMTPTTITDPPDQPYSDGVVCRDSALYQEPTGFFGWAVPPFPTDTWQDPAHNYVHTFGPIYGSAPGVSALVLPFGATYALPVYELYSPPFPGDLVTVIVSTLNAH